MLVRNARRWALATALAVALAAASALGAPAGQVAPRLNIVCTGRGATTVILFAGGGDALSVWRPLQRALSGSARVRAYDRNGAGGGPVPAGPQTFVQMAAPPAFAPRSPRSSTAPVAAGAEPVGRARHPGPAPAGLPQRPLHLPRPAGAGAPRHRGGDRRGRREHRGAVGPRSG